MLNPFPIQYLALFAYFILRVFIGFILLYLGNKHWEAKDELSKIKLPTKLSFVNPFVKIGVFSLVVTEIIIGLMFIAGFYTQIAALILIVMSIKILIFHKHLKHPTIPKRLSYVLFLGVGISLFITGAGVLAFDLPI